MYFCINRSDFVKISVCGQGFVPECDFVESVKCHEKIFSLCAVDQVLEGGSSAQCTDLMSCAEFDFVS